MVKSCCVAWQFLFHLAHGRRGSDFAWDHMKCPRKSMKYAYYMHMVHMDGFLKWRYDLQFSSILLVFSMK
jgi:hypothetical protein